MIAGVDEAGRGALAGPVVAAAVILPETCVIKGLTDSKLLTAEERQLLFEQLIAAKIPYAIGIASHRIIDKINILNTTFKAMQRAIHRLIPQPTEVWVDGNRAPSFDGIPVKTFVQGDRLKPCISAASIIAKVTRDRLMTRQADRYPEYGFHRHKGYGTELHVAKILTHGPSPIQRKTFQISRQLSLLDLITAEHVSEQ